MKRRAEQEVAEQKRSGDGVIEIGWSAEGFLAAVGLFSIVFTVSSF